MRVGILSYPMLFQREGGLQVQIRSTIRALREHAIPGFEVELIDTNTDQLRQFDVLHVFSAINGNHRIIEVAVDQGVPVLLSPLLAPGWNRHAGLRARIADRLMGRLTGWGVQTSYAQTKAALQLSDRIIALGLAEKKAIVAAYLTPANKICILPNGISARFFEAQGEEFRQCFGIERPFVLMVGSISPYKNQAGLVQALAAQQLDIVLIGSAQTCHQTYLQALLAQPRVHWLGQLNHEDPMLASAYAAAAALALPSEGEVFPLAVVEALATGTPVVMTRDHALGIADSEFAITELATQQPDELCKSILNFIAHPPERARVSALVRHLSWPRVAEQLYGHYLQVVHKHQSGEPQGAV